MGRYAQQPELGLHRVARGRRRAPGFGRALGHGFGRALGRGCRFGRTRLGKARRPQLLDEGRGGARVLAPLLDAHPVARNGPHGFAVLHDDVIVFLHLDVELVLDALHYHVDDEHAEDVAALHLAEEVRVDGHVVHVRWLARLVGLLAPLADAQRHPVVARLPVGVPHLHEAPLRDLLRGGDVLGVAEVDEHLAMVLRGAAQLDAEARNRMNDFALGSRILRKE